MAWLPNVANLWHCGSIQLSQLKSLPHVVLHRKQTGKTGKERERERAQDPPFWPTEEKELDSGGDCAFIFFSFCFVFFQPSCLNLKLENCPWRQSLPRRWTEQTAWLKGPEIRPAPAAPAASSIPLGWKRMPTAALSSGHTLLLGSKPQGTGMAGKGGHLVSRLEPLSRRESRGAWCTERSSCPRGPVSVALPFYALLVLVGIPPPPQCSWWAIRVPLRRAAAAATHIHGGQHWPARPLKLLVVSAELSPWLCRKEGNVWKSPAKKERKERSASIQDITHRILFQGKFHCGWVVLWKHIYDSCLRPL